MATQAHCAFCFETLAANFERRKPLSLSQVEELWAKYHGSNDDPAAESEGADADAEEEADESEDAEMTDTEEAAATITTSTSARPAAISRLLNREPSASSSSSSLPSSTKSSAESSTTQSPKNGSGAATPASSSSSRSSIFSFAKRRRSGGASSKAEEYPLFITWNTVSRNGHKSLRGCIGTFAAQELEEGLRSYALTSAFEDVRFQPIPSSLLPSLSAHVTLLTNFSQPSKDALAWTLGKHGIRISFTLASRRYGSTYLPDVAVEQRWTKEETLVSLMRKAGWSGSSSSWSRAWREGKGELVTYEGQQVGLVYAEWKEWRDWVDGLGKEGR